MLSSEDMGQAGYLGPYQHSNVSMRQNYIAMSNILGQTCVFLSKGMARRRQAVRKSAQTSHFCSASNHMRKTFSSNQIIIKQVTQGFSSFTAFDF